METHTALILLPPNTYSIPQTIRGDGDKATPLNFQSSFFFPPSDIPTHRTEVVFITPKDFSTINTPHSEPQP